MTIALFALLLPACNGDEDPGDADADLDADTDSDTFEWPEPGEYGQECPAAERVGVFEVATFEAYSAASGNVAEGVLPTTIHEEVGREGDCALFQKENPFCDPACVSGQLCEDDDGNPDTNGVCSPYPANLDAGRVHVRGLAVDLAMDPDAALNYSETAVPHPLFEPGAAVQLYAVGAQTEAFSLDGAGVAPMESDGDWTLVPGEPFEVTWTPSDGPGRIWISLNVDQHGNSPVSLVCDVEDTGTTTISAAFVDQLIAYGVSGFATGLMRRRTVDSVELAAGCVDLLVYSHLRAALSCEGCL